MRKIEIRDSFCAAGSIVGAAQPDVVKEISLPYALVQAQEDCGREGVFLRQWEISCVLEKPQEAPHSRAERVLLTLDGVYGKGELFIGERCIGTLQPHMELEITEFIRSGSAVMVLRYPPQYPYLLAGERGSEPCAQGGLHSVQLRSIYFAQINSLQMDTTGKIKIAVHAHGAGKVRLCLRVMREETLVWSENLTLRLNVGDQLIEKSAVCTGELRGCTLRAVMDMGSEGCDERETEACVPENTACMKTACFRQLPTEKQLCEIRAAGFDSVALADYPHQGIQRACAKAGLAVWQDESINCSFLYKDDRQPVAAKGALAVPMADEEETRLFRQAQRLCNAAAQCRMRGEAVTVLALCRENLMQDGLFDAQGRARPALYALKNVLGSVAVFAESRKKSYAPYEEFSERIMVIAEQPDGRAMTVRAQLYAWDGTELADRSFPVYMGKRVKEAGLLRARLPWSGAKGLVLRMQVMQEGRLVAVNHACYACLDENGERVPFPKADLNESESDGIRELWNASDAIAVGVCVSSGEKVLLHNSAMLPGERIALAHDAQIMVQYGNAIKKGGKAIAAQRVLRRVQRDPDASSAHPQIEQ